MSWAPRRSASGRAPSGRSVLDQMPWGYQTWSIVRRCSDATVRRRPGMSPSGQLIGRVAVFQVGGACGAIRRHGHVAGQPASSLLARTRTQPSRPAAHLFLRFSSRLARRSFRFTVISGKAVPLSLVGNMTNSSRNPLRIQTDVRIEGSATATYRQVQPNPEGSARAPARVDATGPTG
jgi:hypothetical protein